MSHSTVNLLERLIERSHCRKAAHEFARFRPKDHEKTQLSAVGRGILADCRPLPGSCMIMSALFATRLRQATGAPVYVVAGALSAMGVEIFGNRDPVRVDQTFNVSDPSWDGHAWVMFGPLIADASLIRTARSKGAHPILRTHVDRIFGQGAGMLIANHEHIGELGFSFLPRHVLTDREIDGLANGARQIFETT